MTAQFVWLASISPRRRELLRQIGVPFRTLDVAVDERAGPSESPEGYVTRVAEAKALDGRARAGGETPVIAADTAVVLDGRILGKPADAADGQRMLLALGGRSHQVLTAVAVLSPQGMETALSRSRVTFRAIGADEARAYWETGEPCDKAGGYAIQGAAAVFVADLEGSFSGVMGLPLFEAAALLERAGVPRWRTDAATSA